MAEALGISIVCLWTHKPKIFPFNPVQGIALQVGTGFLTGY